MVKVEGIVRGGKIELSCIQLEGKKVIAFLPDLGFGAWINLGNAGT